MKAVRRIVGMIPAVPGGVVHLGAHPEKAGELRALAREALDALPLGDYWLGFRLFDCGEEYCLPFAVCVRDESTFRSPQTDLAAQGNDNGILYNAGEGGDLTFRLCNLGENRITRVSTLNRPPMAVTYSPAPLSGGDYVLQFHPGDAVTADFGGAGIDFALPDGAMENRFDLTFDEADIREDGTCVVPAAVFQDAVARGCDYYLVVQTPPPAGSRAPAPAASCREAKRRLHFGGLCDTLY